MYRFGAIFFIAFLSFIAIPGQRVGSLDKKTTIIMKKMSFEPKIITIYKGKSITWINKSKNLHNVVFPKLEKHSKLIREGKKVLFTFDKIGEFNYFCQPHKTMGMTGVVKVIDGNDQKQFRDFNSNRVRD